MKYITTACLVVAVLSVLAARAEKTVGEPERITIDLEGAPVSAIITMFQRITGASFVYQQDDIPRDADATLNLNNQPWKPALSAVLAKHGLVLNPITGSPKTYAISKTDSAATAARCRAAQEAVRTTDAVLSALAEGDMATAKQLLVAFRKQNADLIVVVEQKATKTANQSIDSDKK